MTLASPLGLKIWFKIGVYLRELSWAVLCLRLKNSDFIMRGSVLRIFIK